LAYLEASLLQRGSLNTVRRNLEPGEGNNRKRESDEGRVRVEEERRAGGDLSQREVGDVTSPQQDAHFSSQWRARPPDT